LGGKVVRERLKPFIGYFKGCLSEEIKNLVIASWVIAFIFAFIYCLLDFIVYPDMPLIIFSEKNELYLRFIISGVILSAILIALLECTPKASKKYTLWILVSLYYGLAFCLVHISGGVFSPFISIYTLTMFGVFVISDSFKLVIGFLLLMLFLLLINGFLAHNIVFDVTSSGPYKLKCGIVIFVSIVIFAVVEWYNRNKYGNKGENEHEVA
jgi:hypothetical protein